MALDVLGADDGPPGVVVFRRIRFLGLGFEVGGFDPLEGSDEKREVNELIHDGKGENAAKKVDKKRKRSRQECPIRNETETGMKKKTMKFKNTPEWSASYAL